MGPTVVTEGVHGSDGLSSPAVGRLTRVRLNPLNSRQAWVGSAYGGLFSTNDVIAGNWRQEKMPVVPIGAIHVEGCTVLGCSDVWVGTGENSIRRDTYGGIGVFHGQLSITGERTYAGPLGADKFTGGSITGFVREAAGLHPRMWVALSSGQISNPVQAATTTLPSAALGIHYSDDDGATWLPSKRLPEIGAASPATDLAMDAAGTLYAAFKGYGVYRSTNRGGSWTAFNPPSTLFPSGAADLADLARDWVSVTVAGPAVSPVVYAAYSHCPHPAEVSLVDSCVPATFRFQAGSWSSWGPPRATSITANDNQLAQYGGYMHHLAIDPTNADRALYCGYTLWETRTAGSGLWTDVGKAAHPDFHETAFGSFLGFRRVAAVTDGGFYLSLPVEPGKDIGFIKSSDLQRGLHVMEFQSLDTLTTFLGLGTSGSTIVGGTQDNGGLFFSGPAAWTRISGGDVGSVVIDADRPLLDVSPSKIYLTNFGAPVSRTTTAQKVADVNFGAPPNGDAAVYPPLIQDPNPDPAAGGRRPLYLAKDEVYRLVDSGTSKIYQPVGTIGASVVPAPDPDPCRGRYPDTCRTNVITAMAIAPSDSDRIYVGFYDGRVYVSANARASSPTWTLIRGSATAFSGIVTGIAVHPTQKDQVFFTVARAGVAGVFGSDSGGSSPFTDVTGGLDATAINTIAFEPIAPFRLMIGRDDGGYHRASTLAAAPWKTLGVGLPGAPVYALRHDGSGLYAATHGRGVYRLGPPLVRIWRDLCADCVPDISPILPIPPAPGPSAGYTDVPVFAYGLPRNTTCSMKLRQGSNVCAQGTRDPFGRALRTNALGQLVAQDFVGGTAQHAYACANGRCVGDLGRSQCMSALATTLELQCGSFTTTMALAPTLDHPNPASTSVEVALPDGPVVQGVVEIEVALRDASGFERTLCNATTGMGLSDEARDVVGRLRDGLNASADCLQQGVSATLPEPGTGEDAERSSPLQVATAQAGVSLITRLRTQAPGAHFSVRGFGNGELGAAVAPTLQLVVPSDANGGTLGASGGKLQITVGGFDGACVRTFQVLPGETASRLARRIALALSLPSAECPGLSFRQVGLFDVRTNAATLSLRGVLHVGIQTTDPSLVLTVGSRSAAAQTVPPQLPPLSLLITSTPLRTAGTPGTLTTLRLPKNGDVGLFAHAVWGTSARVSPAEVTWSTSDAAIVTVEGATCTGMGIGSATLTARWGSRTATMPVAVVP